MKTITIIGSIIVCMALVACTTVDPVTGYHRNLFNRYEYVASNPYYNPGVGDSEKKLLDNWGPGERGLHHTSRYGTYLIRRYHRMDLNTRTGRYAIIGGYHHGYLSYSVGIRDGKIESVSTH